MVVNAHQQNLLLCNREGPLQKNTVNQNVESESQYQWLHLQNNTCTGGSEIVAEVGTEKWGVCCEIVASKEGQRLHRKVSPPILSTHELNKENNRHAKKGKPKRP